MKDRKILITICARGGSKGIPGKNIKLINGKPLIGYTVDIALELKSKYPDTAITLSTDSKDIRDISEICGLKSDYERPAFLANDICGKVDVVKDAVLYAEKKYNEQYDYVLDLDVTSPIRTLSDLEHSFAIIESDSEALTLFSVNEAARNPYFNMVEQKENGYYSEIIKTDSLTRQSAPKAYDMNASFYIYRRHFFDLGLNDPVTDRSLIYVMPHICFDLDEPMDYEYLSYLISQKKITIG